MTPSQMVADAVKRSHIAHLFHFYPVLCDIAASPRRPPSAWVVFDQQHLQGQENGSAPGAEHLDARQLARACLKEIGKELGAEI